MNNISHFMNISAENFQKEVMDASQKHPVLLEFWAEGYAECQQQKTVLDALIPAYQGKLTWVRLDAADPDPNVQQVAQSLMMQLQLQSLPALLILSEGKPVNVLQGLQSESALTPMLDELTLSPVDRVRQTIEGFLTSGDTQTALDTLDEVLVKEPTNQGLQVLRANVLLEMGRVDEARQQLESLPDDAPGVAQPKAKMAFYEMAASLPTLAKLETLCQQDPDNLEYSYQRAVRLILADRVEESLDALLTIMQKDREFREDGAKALVLKVFDFLGRTHPLAVAYRRRLFSLMH